MWAFLLPSKQIMAKHKIAFNERFEARNAKGDLVKKVALTVRLIQAGRSIDSKHKSVREPSSPQVYEMKFVNGDKITKKTYYASNFADIRDLFITLLQKVVDERNAEKTTIKLNRNNHYFTSQLISCPYCGTKIQRYYGLHRGLEIKCRRCRHIFTSGQNRKK